MAFKKGEFNLEMDPNINYIVDEKVGGNSFIAIRRLRWNDHSEFKLDIRKWMTNAQGEEVAGKGFSFLTEEGPSNLVQGLLELGYGDTRKTLEGIQNREDFLPCVKEIITRKGVDLDSVEVPTLDSLDGATFYDPKNILGV